MGAKRQPPSVPQGTPPRLPSDGGGRVYMGGSPGFDESTGRRRVTRGRRGERELDPRKINTKKGSRRPPDRKPLPK